ncbi:MAG: serine hydrolase [Tepidiformaceae bacterium]
MVQHEAPASPAKLPPSQHRPGIWRALFALALAVFAVSLFVGTWVSIEALRGRGEASAQDAGSLSTPVLVNGGPTIAPGAASATVAAAASAHARTPAATATVHTPATSSIKPADPVAVGTEVGGFTSNTIDDPALLAAITGALGDQVDHYGVVVRRLSDGRTAALNPDKVFYAASTFKLTVLYQAELQHTEGTLNFDDSLTLTDADVSQDLGTLSELGIGAGDSLTISQALWAMVTLSDNTTAVALLHLLGEANIDASLKDLGLTQTSVSTTDLPTTAADMELLMESIVRGRGLDTESVTDARNDLFHQETRNGIPSGLPADVPVGNKTGTWSDGTASDATHDVAFVDASKGTYIIAVLSDKAYAWDPIVAVSKAVYDVLQGE